MNNKCQIDLAKLNFFANENFNGLKMIATIHIKWFFLRIEPSDTRNKFIKCDEQQQNRAHISSSLHRVNSQPHINYRRLSSEFSVASEQKIIIYSIQNCERFSFFFILFALENPMSQSISEFLHEHFVYLKCKKEKFDTFFFVRSCHFALFLFERWFGLYLHSYSPPIKD